MNNLYINAVNNIEDNYNNLDFDEMNIDFNIDLYNNQNDGKSIRLNRQHEHTHRHQQNLIRC